MGFMVSQQIFKCSSILTYKQGFTFDQIIDQVSITWGVCSAVEECLPLEGI